jgi:general secretion pathway protein G
LTLVELIVSFTILMLLTTMALPLARSRVRREKERELRTALETIRKAIDKYKDMADAGQLGQQNADRDNYPESLEVLVEGVKVTGQGQQGGGIPGMGTGTIGIPGAPGQTSSSSSTGPASDTEKKVRFLRRLPKDPFTGTTEWGKLSTRDDPKSKAWGGQNVFDVYSKTMEKAADGTCYCDW